MGLSVSRRRHGKSCDRPKSRSESAKMFDHRAIFAKPLWEVSGCATDSDSFHLCSSPLLGKHLDCYHDSRNQVSKRDANPHQRARAFLVCESRDEEDSMRRQVVGIHNAVTERKKCGKRIAWQRRQEEVQGNAPSRPLRDARPGLDYRPPK